MEQSKFEELRISKVKENEQKEIEKKRKEIQDNIVKIKEEREHAIKSMLENTKRINKNPLYKQLE